MNDNECPFCAAGLPHVRHEVFTIVDGNRKVLAAVMPECVADRIRALVLAHEARRRELARNRLARRRLRRYRRTFKTVHRSGGRSPDRLSRKREVVR